MTHQAAPVCPTDPVDAAMRRAARGLGPESDVLDALAGATVYLPARADGELTEYRDENGSFVEVLTDPQQAPPTAARLLPVGFADLVELLPRGTALWINPESDVTMGVSSSTLRAAHRRTSASAPWHRDGWPCG